MVSDSNTFGCRRNWIAICLLLGLIFAAYGNTPDASWHLDDYASVTNDPRLHLKDLTVDSLWQATLSFIRTPRDARPLSRLTFAVNWYFGRDNPSGYHLVNISIHALTAVFLFLTIVDLLKSAHITGTLNNYKYRIAVLSALLWSLNPIQTQAVTYIVQRMTALAAMFYILGIFLYIKARTSGILLKRAFLLLGCIFCFIFAVSSKENAATLPLALVLVEFMFFRDLSRTRTRNCFFGTLIAVGLALCGLGAWIFFKGDLTGLLDYNFRYFSPLERLLTEPRVVLQYLSQIFYPVPTRLSIEHDIVVSRTLFDPWTTLPAIILVLFFIGFALLNVKKRPLLSFAILFFFLTHLIESSIIGLELVFEHRNYLPSLFIFAPVAAGIIRLLDSYREKNKVVCRAVIACVILIIAGFGTGTYIRNLAWKTEKSLWEDAVTKAPNSGRAWHNLALSHYVPTGQFEKAMVLFRKALTLEKNNTHQESIIYSNMAAVFYYRRNYQEAARYWTRALNRQRNNPEVEYLLCLALTKMGNYEAACKHLDRLSGEHPAKTKVLNLRGVLAVFQGNYREALSYFGICLKLDRQTAAALVNAGAACSLGGHFQKGDWFFKTYLAQHANDRLALLWLANNAMMQGDLLRSESYLNRLLRIRPVKDLISWVGSLENQILYKDTLIIPEVDSRIRARIEKMRNSGISAQNPQH